MTRQEFIDELIRRFTDSVTKGMPGFSEVNATDDPNVFVAMKDGDYYFARILPPGEPIVTFRKATVKENVKEE